MHAISATCSEYYCDYFSRNSVHKAVQSISIEANKTTCAQKLWLVLAPMQIAVQGVSGVFEGSTVWNYVLLWEHFFVRPVPDALIKVTIVELDDIIIFVGPAI